MIHTFIDMTDDSEVYAVLLSEFQDNAEVQSQFSKLVDIWAPTLLSASNHLAKDSWLIYSKCQIDFLTKQEILQAPFEMTRERLEMILSEVSYLDWKFKIDESKTEVHLIQGVWTGFDTDTNTECVLKSRKHFISNFATADEVVKTCWLLVELALKHEAMETFKYLGTAPFHPHNDVHGLLEAPKVYRFDNHPEPK